MPASETRRTVWLAALALAATALLLAVLLRAAPIAHAQTAAKAEADAAPSAERWLHIAVDGKNDKDERVRVNVPISLARAVLASVDRGKLNHGIVHINGRMDDVDVRGILKAIKAAPDGEFVTVETHDTDVKVQKSGGMLLIHVVDACAHHKAKAADTTDNETPADEHHRRHGFSLGCSDSNGNENVDVRVPLEVADALFSGPSDELNVVAALDLLSKHSQMELATVQDSQNRVRIWMNTKTTQD